MQQSLLPACAPYYRFAQAVCLGFERPSGLEGPFGSSALRDIGNLSIHKVHAARGSASDALASLSSLLVALPGWLGDECSRPSTEVVVDSSAG